jgi:hypothetical protein
VARIKWNGYIEKALSTAGYSNIHVKYERRTVAMDAPDEWLFVEWWDGSDWNELEHTRDGGMVAKDMTCGSGADDNANFKVRWRTNVDKNPEFGEVDDVEITGVAD